MWPRSSVSVICMAVTSGVGPVAGLSSSAAFFGVHDRSLLSSGWRHARRALDRAQTAIPASSAWVPSPPIVSSWLASIARGSFASDSASRSNDVQLNAL